MSRDEHDREKLITRLDEKGRTALHTVTSAEVAQLFLRALLPEKRAELIKVKDRCNQTVLHLATDPSVVREIMSHLPMDDRQRDEFIMAADSRGKTCLHRAKKAELATQLLHFLSVEKREEFLMLQSCWSKQTALHTAGNVPLAKTLLSYVEEEKMDELLKCGDSYDQTVLHTAPSVEMTELYLSTVSADKKEEFIMQVDVDGKMASTGKAGNILELVLANTREEQHRDRLVSQHNSYVEDRYRLIERHLIPDSQDINCHTTPGLDGNNPFIWMLMARKVSSVADCLSSMTLERRSEERRVGKECRTRWSPYH